jgi:hypothetical protein
MMPRSVAAWRARVAVEQMLSQRRPGHPPQRRPGHEAVVDHSIGHRRVVIRQEPSQPWEPCRPRDVVPKNAGSIALDQFANLGLRVGNVRLSGLGDQQIAERTDRVVIECPVQAARVVDTEAHVVFPDGIGDLADHVTARVESGTVRVFDIRRPQAVSVVVLGYQHHVTGAGGGETSCPVLWVPTRLPRFEVGHEGLVVPPRVGGGVEPCRRALGEPERILVPLDVGGPRQGVGVASGQEMAHIVADRGERRHRRRCPVHEEPELGIAPPGWDPVSPHRLRQGAGSGEPASAPAQVPVPAGDG